MKYLVSLFALFFTLQISAQDHFLVDLEPRSPDVEAMVQAFEGTKAIPIMANNIDGQQVNIGSLKGKVVLLWFWHLKCDRCIQEISTLNLLQQELSNFEIVSFANENGEELRTFRESMPIDFDVIPSSSMLAEGPYIGEFGFPKMFFIDQSGTIKWVFPAKDFSSSKFDLYNIVKNLHKQLNQ